MLNYEVDPVVLEELLPRGTQLDLWQGRCLVSVVGFLFLDTRVLGFAVPFHRNFEEVNLRFYVQHQRGDELRRGVVFVKELVPRRALAWVANTLYDEKYVALPMRHDDKLLSEERSLSYGFFHRGTWHQLAVNVEGPPYLPELGSEESFITEHYWGYTMKRNGTTLEYQVEHPPWQVWRASSASLACDVASLYGAAFAPFLSGPPCSAFVAQGSEVCVRKGQELSPSLDGEA
jgi:uncharacterized protein YqjF (DUF2071 family)